MKILDVFSWLSARELSMEEIENTVIGLREGSSGYEGYLLEGQIPENANENVTDCKNQLAAEGQILQGDRVWNTWQSWGEM